MQLRIMCSIAHKSPPFQKLTFRPSTVDINSSFALFNRIARPLVSLAKRPFIQR